MGKAVLASLLLTICIFSARAGETIMADPPPSFDAPRQIMLTLNSDDPVKINNVLFNVVNIQKFYGFDNVEIAVILYGAGVRAVLKDETPVLDRITSLLKYEVAFVACGNTLAAMHKPESALVNGVLTVQAGIPEIVERRLRGWHYIHP